MAADDLEVAARFRAALEKAVSTGDKSDVLQLVAPDVEWITPQRTLRGIDELRSWSPWSQSAEAFDYEFDEGAWVDEGEGRVGCDVRQIYRVKQTGDFAYERVRRVELTIEDRKITRYELRFTG